MEMSMPRAHHGLTPAASASPDHTVRRVALVGLKLAMAQLAPLVASLYMANLVAGRGALEFSSFSMVTSINLTMYIVASAFLQGLYFVGGRAIGLGDEEGYDAAIFAGALLAGVLALVAVTLSCSIGGILTALQLDARLVTLAAGLGRIAAAGIPAGLLLVVLRVHSSLRGCAGLVMLTDSAGALLLAPTAAVVVGQRTSDFGGAASSVLLSVVGHNWLLLSICVVVAATLPALRFARGALVAARRRWLESVVFVIAVGWPIGAVVLLDSFASLVSSLLVGRYWVDVLPVHAVALLWAMIGLVVPLGLSQAVVQSVSVAHARRDRRARNRAVAAGMAIGVAYGLLALVVFTLAPRPLGALLLGDGKLGGATQSWVVEIMPWAGLVLAFQGLIVIAAAALRGIGDVRAPLLRALVCYLVIGVGGEVLFAKVLHRGVRGIWWGLALGFGCTALGVSYRCLRAFHAAQPEKEEEE
jgi:MATE family multidrug resistance protein